jgi:hypothetical protein
MHLRTTLVIAAFLGMFGLVTAAGYMLRGAEADNRAVTNQSDDAAQGRLESRVQRLGTDAEKVQSLAPQLPIRIVTSVPNQGLCAQPGIIEPVPSGRGGLPAAHHQPVHSWHSGLHPAYHGTDDRADQRSDNRAHNGPDVGTDERADHRSDNRPRARSCRPGAAHVRPDAGSDEHARDPHANRRAGHPAANTGSDPGADPGSHTDADGAADPGSNVRARAADDSAA